MTIQIVIEGENSQAAAAELLSIPGVTGELKISDSKKADPLTTTVAIITIIGTTLAIAEQFRKWYQESRQNRAGKTFDVLIIYDDGRRILFEDLSLEEVKSILDTLK